MFRLFFFPIPTLLPPISSFSLDGVTYFSSSSQISLLGKERAPSLVVAASVLVVCAMMYVRPSLGIGESGLYGYRQLLKFETLKLQLWCKFGASGE